MSKIFIADDGQTRCGWCGAAPEFLDYHDSQWGFPVADDYRLFEKLSLESFQSGLSWRTILLKRENFRAAFVGFDFNKIAAFTQSDIDRLLQDKGIVRLRGKIVAVINNAKRAQQLVAEYGSLAAFIWRYESQPQPLYAAQSASTSELAVRLCKDLKKLGWKFLGPTTIYAFMQASGLINDHLEGCVIQAEVARAREKFKRPQPIQ